jgi:hypothetical protein
MFTIIYVIVMQSAQTSSLPMRSAVEQLKARLGDRCVVLDLRDRYQRRPVSLYLVADESGIERAREISDQDAKNKQEGRLSVVVTAEEVIVLSGMDKPAAGAVLNLKIAFDARIRPSDAEQPEQPAPERAPEPQ